MAALYPDIRAYANHTLSVDAVHTLNIEECGSGSGIPALFLHGGPGAGCEPYHRRFFDPNRYRIVLLDQRGAGRSTPHAELVNNTTAHLIEDLEKAREYLGIEQWMVFGGSWGSTLALAYAETHPQRVLGLILRGIFLCRPKDIHWFYQDGASAILPDYWQDYLRPIPPDQRDSMVQAYYRRLTGEDEIARMAAAKAWSLWEGRASTLKANESVLNHFGDPFMALSLARIEAHYFVNDTFLEPDQIVRDAHRLRKIPGVIVHGRYDLVCPMDNAWSLHQSWPEAQLEIIDDAGHSATERNIAQALVAATDAMADRLAGTAATS